VHQVHPVAEAREPLSGTGERVGVAVEADEREARVALERRLRVAPETEGGVDEHRPLALEGRGQQLEGALEHDGDVHGSLCHDAAGSGRGFLIPIRGDLAPGKVCQGGRRLGVRAHGQKSPGITSSSVAAKASSRSA